MNQSNLMEFEKEGVQFIVAIGDRSEWDIMSDTSCGGDYEIIGNIYEHPQLLAEKKT